MDVVVDTIVTGGPNDQAIDVYANPADGRTAIYRRADGRIALRMAPGRAFIGYADTDLVNGILKKMREKGFA